ncbi:putative Dol-P-Glc:Glc(2)Man(9)GlcNAc(2)-PP-Dol alpha-1,2-glucosyltransferase [Lingula anatina]|uniref:Dol-P-Glc:Glc(2)Man(9)GlcNAc(2)-PP-Dol alpha-1,2-glucosyltransferase n=1 Tax=Lingula anatina TaxID=7574 RepID=A0A1S3JEU2_LINAN|nr:putative Dol-P-Glc:Glc(2)Man(9)GlcNAc(2)-PP-Dol alpha-1,2-glucosyltransferase [Lingula anatina]|eukprot:XP_013408858.1 putative Dol-P-Glc:Glc(2)Man(9)GlcNAc(2)-PP-Dol alpha-1,2-glucosyltransferase [Lingula anatina]
MAAPGGRHTLAALEVCGVLLCLAATLLFKFDEKQPIPYMDEQFHIGQVIKYCEGNFYEWDPKITTFPGLYLISLGVLKPVGWLMGWDEDTTCSVLNLRAINIMFSIGNFYLFLALIRKIHGKDKNYQDTVAVVTAVVLSLFPVMYFFTFLYYTDPGSTFFTLLMYLLSLHDNHKVAAMMGLVAILFRQTNVIWVAFVAGVKFGDLVVRYVGPEKRDIPKEAIGSMDFLIYSVYLLFVGLKDRTKEFQQLLSSFLSSTWSYILLFVGFAAFIVFNGGIVVGDRSAHVAVLNFPQLFYFSCVTFIFAFPHMLTLFKAFHFVDFLFRRPVLFFMCYLISCVLAMYFTYEHPYLLADNRHYTFYIWRRIYLLHPYMRYILIPAYIYCYWAIHENLQNRHVWWKLTYAVALFLSTVPQQLMEFRYFIIPYLLFRLHSPLSNLSKLMMELVIAIAVNAVTIHLFLNRPFTWPNSNDVQRFMW